MSLKPGAGSAMSMRPTVYGLVGGTMFALSAIGYRGAILSLQLPNFVLAATFTLAVGLVLQSVLLSAYLAVRDVEVLRAIMRAWKPSMLAGFMGAFASQFWFLAFAIATAASVRTLALVEVLMAQAVSKFIFKQPTTPREIVGIVLVIAGVVILLWAH
jgi:drug/metabolite transporter (DMT)-like permease